jgi:hypothetical protein
MTSSKGSLPAAAQCSSSNSREQRWLSSNHNSSCLLLWCLALPAKQQQQRPSRAEQALCLKQQQEDLAVALGAQLLCCSHSAVRQLQLSKTGWFKLAAQALWMENPAARLLV